MITQPTVPVPGETIAEAGERIRAAVPIRGARAIEDECIARRLAIEATLAARKVWHQERCWHTAQLADGQISGVWAQSTEEAELDLTVWHGQRCHWVLADPGNLIRAEYFPQGIRRAVDAGRRFPLAPPRRPRDQFAPAGSLLDPLGAPDSWAGPHH
ncbi:hypothetical protein [Microbacterium aurum]